MMSMSVKTPKSHKEQGFASITVALVLIIVLALLTIAFAQLARHERQSALNKQLASQAQYAAESGINDIMNALKTTPTLPDANTGKCIPLDGFNNGEVDSDRGVYYTCAVVDTNPGELKADIDASGSWGTTFSSTQPLDTLTISWNSRTGQNTPKGSIDDKFATATNWGSSPGVLQVSITPLDTVTRTALINNTFTVYLYPSKPGETTTVAYKASGKQGAIISGACHGASLLCTSSIENIKGASGSAITGPFLIRVLNYYDGTHVVIKGSSGSNDVRFTDSQVKIDVTGKARNVLKRLQVYVPLDNGAKLPGYAIEAAGLCKRFEATPSTTTYRPPSTDDESICDLNLNN